MSDYDAANRSTDLDSHGLPPAVEPDRCAQLDGHGMEAVNTRLAPNGPNGWTSRGSRVCPLFVPSTNPELAKGRLSRWIVRSVQCAEL